MPAIQELYEFLDLLKNSCFIAITPVQRAARANKRNVIGMCSIRNIALVSMESAARVATTDLYAMDAGRDLIFLA